MAEYIIRNIYTISGSILLACFVAYLTFRSYLKQRRIKASDQFRNTIITELSDLYPERIHHISAGSETVRILRAKHSVITSAVNIYRPHVRNKARFDKAWDNFTGIDRFRDKKEEPRYNQYSFKNIQGSHFYDSPKEMFIKNIEQLLEITEKT